MSTANAHAVPSVEVVQQVLDSLRTTDPARGLLGQTGGVKKAFDHVVAVPEFGAGPETSEVLVIDCASGVKLHQEDPVSCWPANCKCLVIEEDGAVFDPETVWAERGGRVVEPIVRVSVLLTDFGDRLLCEQPEGGSRNRCRGSIRVGR